MGPLHSTKSALPSPRTVSQATTLGIPPLGTETRGRRLRSNPLSHSGASAGARTHGLQISGILEAAKPLIHYASALTDPSSLATSTSLQLRIGSFPSKE